MKMVRKLPEHIPNIHYVYEGLRYEYNYFMYELYQMKSILKLVCKSRRMNANGETKKVAHCRCFLLSSTYKTTTKENKLI